MNISKESLQLLSDALYHNLAETYSLMNSAIASNLQGRLKIIQHLKSELPQLREPEVNGLLEFWGDAWRRWKTVVYIYDRSPQVVGFPSYVPNY